MPFELWVVKVGGSLHGTPDLKPWLHALALTGGGRLVIVPGGGPFADHVRAAQRRDGFDDLTAHRRALSAMEQYGRELIDEQPGLRPAATDGALHAVLGARAVPVWMPAAMAGDTADLKCDWGTTSDTLAAWLAARLGAAHLALIKSAPPEAGRWPARQLSAAGVIDRHFGDHLRTGRFRAWWLGRGDHRRFADYINADGLPPAEILSV
jgi:aspartokinase-like uncharacterized kinase